MVFKFGPSDFKIQPLIHTRGLLKDVVFVYKGKCFIVMVLANILQHFLKLAAAQSRLFVKWLPLVLL